MKRNLKTCDWQNKRIIHLQMIVLQMSYCSGYHIQLTLFRLRLAAMCGSQSNWPTTSEPMPSQTPNQMWDKWTQHGTFQTDSLLNSPEPLEIGGWVGGGGWGGGGWGCVNTFRGWGAKRWTRTTLVCRFYSVLLCVCCRLRLLSHGWLRAIKSKCVSVIFLLRWEFLSLPSDGQWSSFSEYLWIGSELLWNKPNLFPHQSIFQAVPFVEAQRLCCLMGQERQVSWNPLFLSISYFVLHTRVCQKMPFPIVTKCFFFHHQSWSSDYLKWLFKYCENSDDLRKRTKLITQCCTPKL